jgi:hypothetical protein
MEGRGEGGMSAAACDEVDEGEVQGGRVVEGRGEGGTLAAVCDEVGEGKAQGGLVVVVTCGGLEGEVVVAARDKVSEGEDEVLSSSSCAEGQGESMNNLYVIVVSSLLVNLPTAASDLPNQEQPPTKAGPHAKFLCHTIWYTIITLSVHIFVHFVAILCGTL